jgi:hypothetical protein
LNQNTKIIFTAAYSYLALPQYIPVLAYLRNIKKIYINFNDPVSVRYDFSPSFSLIKKHFDAYLELKPVRSNVHHKKHIWGLIKTKLGEIKTAIIYKKNIFSLLNETRPSAVISSSDISFSDKIIQMWCYKEKVPFIILQPAFLDAALVNRFSIKFSQQVQYLLLNRILKLPLVTKQKIFGNESNNSFLLLWSKNFILNSNRKNMYFVGSPAFDHLFKSFKMEREVNNVILICTEDIDTFLGKEALNEILKIYSKAFKERPDLTFYMKVHPREPIEKYNSVFPQSKYPNVKILKDYDLYDLFAISDIQISINSASSLEAAAFGIPVITITPEFIHRKIQDFFRGEINIRVSKPDEIMKAIDTAFSENYWKEFILKRKKYFETSFNYIDGSSSKNTAETIISIIGA